MFSPFLFAQGGGIGGTLGYSEQNENERSFISRVFLQRASRALAMIPRSQFVSSGLHFAPLF